MTLTLREVCEKYGPSIRGLMYQGRAVDGSLLLWAIAGCESAFGRQREFVRAEPAYMPGGRYHRAPHLRGMYQHWGVLAASSFGSFQILFVAAAELGYSGHPIDLQKDETCGMWATELIKRRFIVGQGAKTLRDVLDAYNSGTYKDAGVPESYIEKAERYYVAGFPDGR
jgi:hypothetical protein